MTTNFTIPPRLLEFARKNKKVLVINAVAIAVLVFGSISFLILPLLGKNNALKTVKANNETVLNAQKLLIAKKGNIKGKIERLNMALPADSQILNLGSSLQTMAVKNGMLLKTINFKTEGNSVRSKARASQVVESEESDNVPAVSGKTTETPSVDHQSVVGVSVLQSVPISLTLVGSEEDFKKFLHTLETNLRLIDIEDMKLPEAGVEIEKRGNMYVLELKTYYLPNSE